MAVKYVAIVLAIVFVAADAKPYSKYGRTCKDIGCRTDEDCVMVEEPCGYGSQRDQCGHYPTCKRRNGGGESCLTKICPSGQYCRTDNGRPTCVNTNSALAFDSAGVSSVNGQTLPGSDGRQQQQEQQRPAVPADPYGSRYANGNVYANANAPPAEEVLGSRNGSGPPSRSGYPPYPSSSSNMNNPYGYPAYPSNNSNRNNYNGNVNNGYPPYLSSSNNGYPAYPASNNRPNQHNYPQMNPVWNDVHQNSVYSRRNCATSSGASTVLLLAISVVGCLRIIEA